ncbi:MAG: CapA family protein [Peptococcaceae bacterium]|nr:CapA family protein [Peptococcaceae bacterium]
MSKKLLPLTLILVSLCLLVVGGFWAFPKLFDTKDPGTILSENPNDPSSSEPLFTDIDLACVGDILIHNTVFLAAQTSPSEYDFRPQFTHVKPLLEKADLTIANLEVPLGGPSQSYSGYPQFNCPDTITDALKDAGVDVVTHANNHCMDTGQAGFFRTIDIVRGKGLDIIGTRKNEQEPPYLIKTLKGVPIGLISFGYGSSAESGTSINGLPLPSSMANLLNFVDYDHLDSELEKLRATVSAARADGARVIVVCMHWGNEYQLRSDPPQQRVAQELAELRVDIVFGSHPHVLQEAAYVSAKTSPSAEAHSTLVYYSLGNFISDQRLETVNNIHTEHGMIAQVTLRHHADGRNEILSGGYTATWVNKKTSAKTLYEIIPVAQALDDLTAFPNLVPADRSRLLSCQESVENLMAGIKP